MPDRRTRYLKKMATMRKNFYTPFCSVSNTKRKILPLILISLTACFGQSGQTDTKIQQAIDPLNIKEYVWFKRLDSADWKKCYNFQMFTIQDTLWVFHPDGNWFSTDGTNWAKSALPNAINNLAFLDY